MSRGDTATTRTSRLRSLFPSFAVDAWLRESAEARSSAIRPADAPEAHASGCDPDRILIWGDGPVAGLGVRSHDLALPGCLARRISFATGRGADVIALPAPDLQIKTAEEHLRTSRFATYDAIVVFVGVRDAVHRTSVDSWERRVRSLLAHVTGASAATTRIVVMGIAVGDLNPSFRSTFGSNSERHAHRLNAATQAVCAEYRNVSFLAVPAGRDRAELGVRTAGGYRDLADVISAHLAPQLTIGAAQILHDRTASSAREVRNGRQNETARQNALDELQLRSLQGHPALERITAHARAAFGTESALITVIDHDKQWYAAGGQDLPASVDRTSAFCDHTIRRAEPLVVPDATKDPRFADSPLVTGPDGVRFYAGFPIESPDGHRIGALCVVDSKPHDADEVSTTVLRDLALLVQRELRAHAHGIGFPTSIKAP